MFYYIFILYFLFYVVVNVGVICIYYPHQTSHILINHVSVYYVYIRTSIEDV